MEQLSYRRLTEKDKRQICAWQYEGEYAIYNLLPYEEMRAKQVGFMNEKAEKKR